MEAAQRRAGRAWQALRQPGAQGGGDHGPAQDEVQDIFVAGLLHDMGFMALPDSIMSKPVGKLTPEELASYQRHPVLGAQAFMALDDHQTVHIDPAPTTSASTAPATRTNSRARRFHGAHTSWRWWIRTTT